MSRYRISISANGMIVRTFTCTYANMAEATSAANNSAVTATDHALGGRFCVATVTPLGTSKANNINWAG